MSMMQNFRDGYSVGARWRPLWRSLWKIVRLCLAVALMIVTAINLHDGDIQRATFDAVIVLWLLQD